MPSRPPALRPFVVKNNNKVMKGGGEKQGGMMVGKMGEGGRVLRGWKG